MHKIIIEGGYPLHGEIAVSGAKNAALPLIAATLLTNGSCVIDDIPWLSDVENMCQALVHLGAKSSFSDNRLEIDTTRIHSVETPTDLVRKMRASLLLMGPLLAREGRVRTALPGGCAIGSRPIDLHLKGFEAMGATVTIGQGFIEAQNSGKLKGARIYLDFPSVGATENIMMAAALAEGSSVIENAAEEPEIVDLSNFLNAMGAKIKGAGTNIIRIEGVESLHPVCHTVIPDRIEAGSYMLVAACQDGSDVIINNVIHEHLKSITAKLQEAGVFVEELYDGIRIMGSSDLNHVDLKTMPYPGFPTDMQAQFMAMLSTAKGSSLITETVFENRFMHVQELKRMAADIRIEGNCSVVNGVKQLFGTSVRATDLRAGAAMIIAALKAKGKTEILDVYHIERGYEKIVQKLEQVGAKISTD